MGPGPLRSLPKERGRAVKQHRYGWIRDTPDQRDRVFRAQRPAVLPKRVDLRPLWPGILDQGNLGSWLPCKAWRYRRQYGLSGR